MPLTCRSLGALASTKASVIGEPVSHVENGDVGGELVGCGLRRDHGEFDGGGGSWHRRLHRFVKLLL